MGKGPREPWQAHEQLAVAVLALTLWCIAFTIFMLANCLAGELVICNVEPRDPTGWHYRTMVGGLERRCWYQGERMKPRSELYWAETPATAPLAIPFIQESGEFEQRWPRY
jgi:hypothetical protein